MGEHSNEPEKQTVNNPAGTPIVPPKRSLGKTRKRWFITGFLLALMWVIAGVAIYDSIKKQAPTSQVASSNYDGNEVREFKGGGSISEIAAKVSPSVVSIVTSQASYFEDSQGAGTGIIISKDGYILTNKHVIEGADKAQIILADGTTYDDVTVVGADPLNDIGFLKIKGVNNLPVAVLGDSSSVKVGQEVIAIGNTLGEYQTTVTNGIISGTGRPIEAGRTSGQSTESLVDLLQTDAAINPGNSGGPLLNAVGQVIGVNTAIIQGAQGIGFAIPINSTKGIINGLMKTGKIQRAYLGVRYVSITPSVVKRYNLSVKNGAYIPGSDNQNAIEQGGPADKAGLKNGDIITKLSDTPLGRGASITTLVGEHSPGDKVDLTVLRDGKELTLSVTLGAYKS